jgi:WhiB family transcriptional regulator, redox-sensing transcriptional regulator
MRTIRITRPTWMDTAECRGGDPAVIRKFFPGVGKSAEPAKKVCAGCASVQPCLTYALEHPELSGVWGGKTDNERDQLRRRRSA